MRHRSKARARVLQLLYAWEMRGAGHGLREADAELEELCAALDAEGAQYAHHLLDAIETNLAEIDRRIEELSDNWRLNRMTVIDRNILRVAAAEMLYCEDVPPRVSVHEAIKLADLFGSDESRRFINGVLDSLLHKLEPKRQTNTR